MGRIFPAPNFFEVILFKSNVEIQKGPTYKPLVFKFIGPKEL